MCLLLFLFVFKIFFYDLRFVNSCESRFGLIKIKISSKIGYRYFYSQIEEDMNKINFQKDKNNITADKAEYLFALSKFIGYDIFNNSEAIYILSEHIYKNEVCDIYFNFLIIEKNINTYDRKNIEKMDKLINSLSDKDCGGKN